MAAALAIRRPIAFLLRIAKLVEPAEGTPSRSADGQISTPATPNPRITEHAATALASIWSATDREVQDSPASAERFLAHDEIPEKGRRRA